MTKIYGSILIDSKLNKGSKFILIIPRKLQAYWKIGEQIYLAYGENDRAGYGKGLIKYSYRILMRVDNKERRDFYHEECVKANWSVRQLERQINTMYYDRILASKDKVSVANEIQQSEPKPEYERIIKDPYVLEFFDLEANPHFYEKILEQQRDFTAYKE